MAQNQQSLKTPLFQESKYLRLIKDFREIDDVIAQRIAKGEIDPISY